MGNACGGVGVLPLLNTAIILMDDVAQPTLFSKCFLGDTAGASETQENHADTLSHATLFDHKKFIGGNSEC